MINKLFLMLILLMPGIASAMNVTIEPGSMKDDKSANGNKQADLNLSGLIVRKVLWQDGALLMPVTVSNDRSYNDVKLISRELYRKMEDCFVNGCRESSSLDNPPLPSIGKIVIRKLNSKIRVSNIEISFDNGIVVSVGIMAENYPDGTFWLSYPQSIGFSSSRLQKEADDFVFRMFSEENPHLKVVRAEQGGANASAAAKAEEEEAKARAKENEESGQAVVKTIVFDDESRPSRKTRKARTKKTSAKKSRKRRSSSSYYYSDEAAGLGSIYEAR